MYHVEHCELCSRNMHMEGRNKTHVETLEMWCWRNMLKVSWTERMLNEEIPRRVGEKRTLVENRKKKEEKNRTFTEAR